MNTITDSRVRMYLGQNSNNLYQNTDLEDMLVLSWNEVYLQAKNHYEATRVNSKKVKIWRDAYKGNFKALDAEGNPTDKNLKALRKVCYELVKQRVDAIIPFPKMLPRHHADIKPVNSTEALIKHELNKMLPHAIHNESEHATLIDSTSWFKVIWNPFDNVHERSGMPKVEVCPIDTVYPQPGVFDYKKLEYIFERKQMTLAQITDLYGRNVATTNGTDLVEVIECYFLNENRHVGKFAWVNNELTVLCNDLEWQIRRRRECLECNHIEPIAAECSICASSDIGWVAVQEQILSEDLEMIANPFRAGESANSEDDSTDIDESQKIPAGTKIPFYLIRQLPFVPRRTEIVPQDIYGVSEVALHLEPQDLINKFYNKAEQKSMQSKTYVTKLKDTRINDENQEVVYIETEDHHEASAIQVRQVTADIQAEIGMAMQFYEGARATAGVTDADQGRPDPTARSGVARELAMMASQARQSAPNEQRKEAYAGVYELIFKNLLAFSDETRSFINILPDGSTKEETWSKYMFLDKDPKTGEFFYRDDFAWMTDEASSIQQDRMAMWQLIQQDFLNGTMGTEIDPARALRMYWHMKDQHGYPTAKFALAFLDDAVQKLPTQIEQALVQNPEAVEMALAYIAQMQAGQGLGGQAQTTPQAGAQGGARNNAGRASSGQSTAQRQTRDNNRAQAAQQSTEGGIL